MSDEAFARRRQELERHGGRVLERPPGDGRGAPGESYAPIKPARVPKPAPSQASSFDRLSSARPAAFDSRGGAGTVRTNCWDRIAVPGVDEKDGQSTRFDVETMSQMIDNFKERGDAIPLDANHQSTYAPMNGQPAPALAWYTALALVANGRVVKVGCARNVGEMRTGGEGGIDLARDGLWGLRSEVTPLGQQLLPNFKYVSPTFLSNGTRRDGSECGYSLCAVASTNTPWQSGTQITFDAKPAPARKPDVGGPLYASIGERMATSTRRR